MQLPRADPRPEEKICTSHVTELIQAWGLLQGAPVLSRAGFSLQFSHKGHVSHRAPGRASRRFLRLPSCLELLQWVDKLCPASWYPQLPERLVHLFPWLLVLAVGV